MTEGISVRKHKNPVWEGYFADPFVCRHEQIYYAIGTGASEATGQTSNRIFPMLSSVDFFRWEFAGNALVRPDPDLGNTFWAPAMVAAEGRFFLYYSVGFDDKRHQLRVAESKTPTGPFHDTGKPLIDPDACPFAIDPHPFCDEDGQWYLFYARDFLNTDGGFRAGTALAAASMKSFTELADPGVSILRAEYEWQRFQANREMYQRVWDWHTLEGPCVHKHSGRYYCFYSGGRWENDTYGVDFGVADHVLGPYSTKGAEGGARVLRTIPGQLLGPGHNTLIAGSDGETDYIVYHAWDPYFKARSIYIERLFWLTHGPASERFADRSA